MPIQRAQVVAVACNVPGCHNAEQFLMPCDLQKTGWLEVALLGDLSTMKRAFICPEHAKPLGLGAGSFEESAEAQPAAQGFNAIDRVPFLRQVFPEFTPQLAKVLLGKTQKQITDGKSSSEDGGE